MGARGGARAGRRHGVSAARARAVLWVLTVSAVLAGFWFPGWLKLIYPLPHSELVFAAAAESGVDPYLVFAVIRAESAFRVEAQSSAGARGLMQLMPDTAREIAAQMQVQVQGPEDIMDPELNVRMGCWYLARLSREFDGRLPPAIAAYNAGRGKVREWLESGTWDGALHTSADIPFPETRRYVQKVMADYAMYRQVYHQPELEQ